MTPCLPVHSTEVGRDHEAPEPDQVDLLRLFSKEFVSQFKFTLQGTKTYRWDLSVVAGIGDSIIFD